MRRANYVINVVNNIETKYQQNVSESLVQITYRQYIDNNDPSEMSRGLAADIMDFSAACARTRISIVTAATICTDQWQRQQLDWVLGLNKT